MAGDLIEGLERKNELQRKMLDKAASAVKALRTALAAEREAREKAEKEVERLSAVIKKAEDDIDMARFGEGYGFNLPFVVYDLREALHPQQTAVAEDWQQNNEHGGYPIVVQLPGNAITRLWRRFAARFLAQESSDG